MQPAIPDNLIESELFGYQTGAFTGADKNRVGRVQDAHRGTLSFDEIGELAIGAQGKLLHILQDGEFHSLGSNQTVRVDVRVLAATNRDLRIQDIRKLADHFIRQCAQQFDRRESLHLTNEQYECLEQYSWPGNVRELENFVKTLVLFNHPRSAFGQVSEILEGKVANNADLLTGAGFVLFPSDQETNDQCVFAPKSAVKKFAILSVVH